MKALALLRRLGLPMIIGGFIVLFWIVVALTIDLWSPYDPFSIVGRRLRPPSDVHWLGTDGLGRDVLVRTLYGVRHSLPIALVVVLVSSLGGAMLGAIAGYLGGKTDSVIMRLVDITLSFPAILLAMAVTAALGPGLGNAAVAMVVVSWPVYARLMRAQVLTMREREHVEAAVAAGAGRVRVLTRHILPLCWSPVLVNATMDLGQIVLLAASLSFIGLGALPPTPEWGQMIAEGAVNFYQWWVALGPGLAILSVVLGFNFLGDGLRDLLDPRSAQ
ncbi:MAG: ABC transporter permease [Alphaproteobacteria bacterium]|jgi:peptide/nickel transport system permease protein|nr:ABC transporter permease [Alphaproteobacteria bacterium]